MTHDGGHSCNRRDPSRRLTPAIYAIKVLLRRLQEDREVVLFCDLHGHSRKHNVFCYGCEQRATGRKYQEMVFPRLMWRNSSIFSFSDCSFKVQRSKESTARVVVKRELGVVNSFTMEATLAGNNFGLFAGKHLGPTALREVGHTFCDTILDYFDPNPSKREAILDELRLAYPSGFNAADNDSDGSDGNPEEDCADLDELEKEMLKKKKAHAPNTAVTPPLPPPLSSPRPKPPCKCRVPSCNPPEHYIPNNPQPRLSFTHERSKRSTMF